MSMFKLGIISASTCLLLIATSVNAIEYKPYTKGDIDAKISCAVAISKAEFKIGTLGVLGTPRVCHGAKGAELKKWDCVISELDKENINFTQALGVCLP